MASDSCAVERDFEIYAGDKLGINVGFKVGIWLGFFVGSKEFLVVLWDF